MFYFGNFEGMRYKVGAPSLINTPTTSRIAQTPDDSVPLAIEGLLAHGVAPSPLSLNLAGWINGNHSRTQMTRGVWVRTPNSSWVNEVRFGWNRYGLTDYNAECTRQVGQPDYAQLGLVSGANPPSPMCGFPVVNIGGGAQSFAGLGSGTSIADQLLNQHTETIYDNASYIRGKHQFRFGVEYHHSAYNGLGAPGNFDGTINFDGGLAFAANGGSTALQDFLAGKPFSGSILVNPQYNSLGFNRYAGYVSDDFRLSRKVTMNLGLRYELEPALLVDHNNAANFDPTSSTHETTKRKTAL